MTPESVAALARPALAGEADFVSPAYARHPLDGAARHPGRAAALPRRLRPRARGAARRRVRLLGPLRRALPRGARVGERRPAPRRSTSGSRGWRPATGYAWRRSASALAGSPPAPGRRWPPSCRRCSTRSSPASGCRRPAGRRGRASIPAVRAAVPSPDPPEPPAVVDGAGYADALPRRPGRARSDARAGAPADHPRGAARRGGTGRTRGIPDDLWAAVVLELAAAHRHASISRDHLVRAAVPLYLGRVAVVRGRGGGTRPAMRRTRRLEALCLQFERSRDDLVALWTAPAR